MLQTKRISNVLCGAVLIAINGCASNPDAISLSLSQMGTEEKVDAGSFLGDLHHRRSYNITGLGAVDAIGMVSVDPDPSFLPSLSLTRDRLPDNLAMRLSPDCSLVVTSDFGSGDVKLSVVLAARKAVAAVENLHELQVVQTLEGVTLDLLTKAYEEEAKTPLDARKDKTAYREKIEMLVNSISPSKSQNRAVVTSKSAVELRTNALVAEIAVTRSELANAKIELDNALSTPGIIISRWALAKKKVTSFEALDAARLRSQSEEEQTGFLVLGNPRVVTLLVGDDLLYRSCKAEGAECQGFSKEIPQNKRSGIDSAIKPEKQYITSYQLLAEHWTWLEDRSAVRVREMTISIDKLISSLTSLSGPIAAIEKLGKIKADIQSTTSLALSSSNSGVFSSPKLTFKPFSFATDHQHQLSVKDQILDQNRFGRIISMRTTMDSYIIKMNEKVRTPLTSREHCSIPRAPETSSFTELTGRCNTLSSSSERAACLSETEKLKVNLTNWIQR